MEFKGGQIVKSVFQPFSLLANPHAQTIWPTLFRKMPLLKTERERLTTSDDDFMDIDWHEIPNRPLIVLIHGLASSSKAKYIKGLQLALAKNNYASVAMNLRGCSGESNRKAHSYHGGVSGDLDFVIRTLQLRFPGRMLGAVGFSLGANILLKWLSEVKEESPLYAAVSVSAPLQLGLATSKLQRGFSKIYGQYLLSFLKWDQYKKIKMFKANSCHDELKKIADAPSIWKLNNIGDFDEYFTAPLHGFACADDYYKSCSSRKMLRHIQSPTLIIHAKDDPFMTDEILPNVDELSTAVMVEVSNNGGHVGFIGKNDKGMPYYWLEEHIPQFFHRRFTSA